MRKVVKHPVYGKIIYTEGAWTGKKELELPEHEVQRVSKRSFLIDGKSALLVGNFLTGLKLHIEGEAIEISTKPKWYEFVIAFLPFAFLITWGNSATLCSIFPVVGGAIGGALGGIGLIVSLLIMKKSVEPFYKVITGLGIFAATILAAFLLALLLVLIIA
jgi:hypothetical protein